MIGLWFVVCEECVCVLHERWVYCGVSFGTGRVLDGFSGVVCGCVCGDCCAVCAWWWMVGGGCVLRGV